MTKKKHILSLSFFTLLIIGFSACKSPELVFPISSQEIVKQYVKHKWRSNRWYRYKEIEVQGTISQNYKNKKGDEIIILARQKDAVGVSCTIENPDKLIKKPLKQNQIITIKGMCIGIDKHVELKKCTIISYNKK